MSSDGMDVLISYRLVGGFLLVPDQNCPLGQCSMMVQLLLQIYLDR